VGTPLAPVRSSVYSIVGNFRWHTVNRRYPPAGTASDRRYFIDRGYFRWHIGQSSAISAGTRSIVGTSSDRRQFPPAHGQSSALPQVRVIAVFHRS
jgi:hypothetical protein